MKSNFITVTLKFSAFVSNFRIPFVIRYSEKWKKKAQEISKFLSVLDIPAESLVSAYAGTELFGGRDRAEVFAEIMSSKPSAETIEYLDKRCTNGFDHFRGGRSGAEYAADLIISWIQEDAILSMLASSGIAIELDGVDKLRDFLPGAQVRATSDFVVTGSYGKRKLEVAYDSTGYWRSNHKYDLRDSKYQRLINEDALIFGIAIQTVEGFLLDLSTDLELKTEAIPFHHIYKKPAYSIVGIDTDLQPLVEAVAKLQLIVG